MDTVYVLELVEFDDYARDHYEVLLDAVYTDKLLADTVAEATKENINRKAWQKQKDHYSGLADYRPSTSYGCDGREVYVRAVPVIN